MSAVILSRKNKFPVSVYGVLRAKFRSICWNRQRSVTNYIVIENNAESVQHWTYALYEHF